MILCSTEVAKPRPWKTDADLLATWREDACDRDIVVFHSAMCFWVTMEAYNNNFLVNIQRVCFVIEGFFVKNE